MANLNIRIYPDPILRKRCSPVESVGQAERDLLNDMAQTMYSANGVGLAAPQVGIDKQLIVVDVGRGLMKLANPRILEAQGEDVMEEGCLCLPGITVKVKRSKGVELEALDENNRRLRLYVEDLTARAIQHEIEHLSGILIVDKVGWKERLGLRKKLRALKEKGASKYLPSVKEAPAY